MSADGREIQAVGGYRPEIDGLRMIAVVSVIFYHAGIPGFGGGYVGVDIFFVISGFLITAIIARELDSGNFSFIEFYERRARRILPALFAMCLVTAIAAWILLSPGQLRHFGQSLVATMGFAANVYFYLTSGYFDPSIHTLPLIHMWSLAVEEQFYVIFPIALIVIARVAPRYRQHVIVGVFALSLALSVAKQVSWPLGNFYLVVFRAWELMAGSLIALNEARIRAWASRNLQASGAIAWVGLASMVAPIFVYSDETVFPGLAATPVVFGTAAFIAATAADGTARRMMAVRPFVAIGLVSYAAYLWHQPLFAFAEIQKGAPPTFVGKLVIVGLTFAIAWLSLVLVERPFRRRSTVSRRTVFAFSLVGIAVFSIVGAALHLSGGFPERFSAEKNAMAATMTPSPKRDVCHTWGTDFRQPDRACRYFSGPTRWAVLGDSHGIEIGYALAEQLRKQNAGLVHLTFSGCIPAYTIEVANPGCSAWTRRAVAWLAQQTDIGDVLLVYRHAFYLYGDQTRSYPAAPDDYPRLADPASPDRARALYWSSMRAEIAALRAAGKRVWVLGPIPDLPVHAEQLVFTPGKEMASATLPLEWQERRTGAISRQLRKLSESEGARYIDPAEALCDASGCAWRDAERMLYFDDNHLSMAGARQVVGRALLPNLN